MKKKQNIIHRVVQIVKQAKMENKWQINKYKPN